MENLELTEMVKRSLAKVRPYLEADGGDVELIEIDDSFNVHVKLIGACSDCPHSMSTLKAGVEMVIKQDVPEINQVFSV